MIWGRTVGGIETRKIEKERERGKGERSKRPLDPFCEGGRVEVGSINLGSGGNPRRRFVGLIIADVAPDDKGGSRVRCTV